MKIVLSPAKSLNFETPLPTKRYTEPQFLEKSKKIQNILQGKTPKELADLMSISEKLGELNWKRNQDWNFPFTPENARPALFAFNGDVYTGLDAYSLESDQLSSMQENIRILSGLYGLLKPLDLIQPYRLEMGTKLPIESSKNLYEFWKPTLTQTLNQELQQDELFVNLASIEYFSVIDTKKLKVPVITPEFKEYKNGTLKVISFFAKKARGQMARYLVEHNAQTANDLKNFNRDGYQFDDKLSQGNKLVFTR